MDIIKSLLDTDVYKWFMWTFVRKYFPDIQAQFKFVNRGEHQFVAGFADMLRAEVDAVGNRFLTEDEIIFLQTFCHLQNTSAETLRNFRMNPDHVEIIQTEGKLEVTATGTWWQVMHWEIYLMEIISELNYRSHGEVICNFDWLHRTEAKGHAAKAANLKISEFGGRRRYSSFVQHQVYSTLRRTGGVDASSNALQAKHRNEAPKGTQAHELYMILGAIYGPEVATRIILQLWYLEYGNDLAIALPDTFTTPFFLRIFAEEFGAVIHPLVAAQLQGREIPQGTFAQLYKGVRQDSGDPNVFAQRMLDFYAKLGIDSNTKIIIFSDGIKTITQAAEMAADWGRYFIIAFGIGTSFTNDMAGSVRFKDDYQYTPMNIVVKPFWAWTKDSVETRHPTIKLSDATGKITGDTATAERLLALVQAS